jgi:hypothetical protein
LSTHHRTASVILLVMMEMQAYPELILLPAWQRKLPNEMLV